MGGAGQIPRRWRGPRGSVLACCMRSVFTLVYETMENVGESEVVLIALTVFVVGPSMKRPHRLAGLWGRVGGGLGDDAQDLLPLVVSEVGPGGDDLLQFPACGSEVHRILQSRFSASAVFPSDSRARSSPTGGAE